MQWTDQPKILGEAGSESILHIHVGDARSVEIHRVRSPSTESVTIYEERWFVTIGSLFGSGTVEVSDAIGAIRTLNWAARNKTWPADPAKAPGVLKVVPNQLEDS